jgi:hypothetical protein
MELVRFRETVYGRLQGTLFLWEPTWDSFRPIRGYLWNGTTFVHESDFADIWDPYYGYGSSDMKRLCKKLSESVDLNSAQDIQSLDHFWTWCRTPTEWFRDRRCAFTACASKDAFSWKRLIGNTHSKPKTLRHHAHVRSTRRLRFR